jgi:hypothetical protein
MQSTILSPRLLSLFAFLAALLPAQKEADAIVAIRPSRSTAPRAKRS